MRSKQLGHSWEPERVCAEQASAEAGGIEYVRAYIERLVPKHHKQVLVADFLPKFVFAVCVHREVSTKTVHQGGSNLLRYPTLD
jgi:hypothetical protein